MKRLVSSMSVIQGYINFHTREPIWSAEGANNQLTIQKKKNGRNSQIERIKHGRKKRIDQKNIGDGVPGTEMPPLLLQL